MGIENLDIKNYREIVDNATQLVNGKPSKERQVQKARIKSILNGGVAGMKALLGEKMESSDADLLPAPNMLQSGIDRLAQKISGIPQVRVDILNHNTSDRAKFRAEKLERIVGKAAPKMIDNIKSSTTSLESTSNNLNSVVFSVWSGQAG